MMKTIKSCFALFLACTLLLSAWGCQRSPTGPTEPPTTGPVETKAPTDAPEPPPEETDDRTPTGAEAYELVGDYYWQTDEITTGRIYQFDGNGNVILFTVDQEIGTYTIENNTINIHFTKRVFMDDPEEPVDETVQLTIMDENTLTDEYNAVYLKSAPASNEIKELLQDYLDLAGVYQGSPLGLLVHLGLTSDESAGEKLDDNYVKTDIKYADYKAKMLAYMTEQWFEDNFTNNFKNVDGYLSYFDGGATGIVYEVQNVFSTLIKGDSYSHFIAEVYNIHMDDEKEPEEVGFEASKENGNWVIAYCNI